MVLSEDDELIDHYLASCEAVDAADYLDRFPG